MEFLNNKQKLNPYMENLGKITNIYCLQNGNILSISDKGEIILQYYHFLMIKRNIIIHVFVK